jgi:transposase
MGPLQESVYKRIWRLRMTQPTISNRNIAKKVRVHRNTVIGTLQRVAGGGTLLPNTNKRKLYRNRLLGAGELAAVRCMLKKNDELYIQEIQLELHKLTGKPLSYGTVRRAIRGLGFTNKVVSGSDRECSVPGGTRICVGDGPLLSVPCKG